MNLTYRTVICLLGLFYATTAMADRDHEHEALAQLVHELDALKPLIETAQQASDPSARLRFQYDWLRQDVERMQSGIQMHLTAPRRQPRDLPPLKGDYRY